MELAWLPLDTFLSQDLNRHATATQETYPHFLWITLWIARCVFRKLVFQHVACLVLLNFSAAPSPSDDKGITMHFLISFSDSGHAPAVFFPAARMAKRHGTVSRRRARASQRMSIAGGQRWRQNSDRRRRARHAPARQDRARRAPGPQEQRKQAPAYPNSHG
jgi:hypothetical protein